MRLWTEDSRERLGPELFARRVAEAAALRERCGIPQRTDAWRVVNGEGDRCPALVVDRFGDWLALTPSCSSLDRWLDWSRRCGVSGRDTLMLRRENTTVLSSATWRLKLTR